MDNTTVLLISNNVKGLQSDLKRRKLFHFFNSKPDAHIILLQETHCTEKEEKQWTAEWGGRAFFSNGTSDARGVCILVKNNIDIEIANVTRDTQGRYLQLNGTLQDKSISIANVYAPNNDDIQFFEYIHQQLESADTDHQIMAGDFNTILDNEKDKRGGAIRHANNRTQDFLNTWIEESELLDIWRHIHPEDRKFTYHQKRPCQVFTRLDYFIISMGLSSHVKEASILPAYCTDHCMLSLGLNLMDQQRGRGFWKLNNQLLQDQDYLTKIKEVIKDTIRINHQADEQLLWETIKLNVRGETIKYAAYKKKKSQSKLLALEATLIILEKAWDETGVEPANIDEIRREIDEIREEKTKGAMMRCKVRWYEEGEKSTKYFLNLEKRNYNKKVISRLRTKHNGITIKPDEIAKEQRQFYKALYSSKITADENEDLNQAFMATIPQKLTARESQCIEGEITERELLTAVKSMPTGKSPGSDGFTSEFYKAMWNDIKTPLIRSINASYHKKKMSVSQRHGIITLIPKKGKDLLELKNWRPISLLNLDYKLTAKCIAQRIKQHLPKLINGDQTGFLKGRYIGENINRILTIMENTEIDETPGLIASIDFEKAFDSLEWSFINRTLSAFNFGHSIISWVKTLYNETESCILNNGWAGQRFTLERGVRQGCPLSPYLFLLSAEILACYIRSKTEIAGIKINGIENKIAQFADDTNLFLQYDNNALNEAFLAFENYSKISGLKVNLDKTEILPIGSIRNQRQPQGIARNIKWSPDGITVLGIFISYKHSELIKRNFDPILLKLENITRIWARRNLSLLGKITIIKSYLQSQMVYQLSVLPSPPATFVNKAQKIMFKFLWNNKPDKIKRVIMYGTRAEGGLTMPHIENYNVSLKASWIKRLTENTNKGWARTALKLFQKGKSTILMGNISIKQLEKEKLLPKSKFWSEVVRHWANYNFKDLQEIEDDTVNHQPLWFNQHIQISNKVIFFQHWKEAGVNTIKDLKDEYGKMLSYDQFINKYQIESNFLEFFGVISAIPRAWISNTRVLNTANNHLSELLKHPKPNKTIYYNLIQKIDKSLEHLVRKWKQDLNDPNLDDQQLSLSFKNLHKCTTNPKARTFQFKLLHRNIGNNSQLHRWGIKENNRCDLCEQEEETIIHLFHTCEIVKIFWEKAIEWIDAKFNIQIEWSPTTIILASTSTPIINLAIITAKQHIYSCKMRKSRPTLDGFTRQITHIQKIEEYIAMKNNKIEAFNKKWKPNENPN